MSDSSAALCELSSPNKGRLSGLSALRGAEPALTQEQPPLKHLCRSHTVLNVTSEVAWVNVMNVSGVSVFVES